MENRTNAPPPGHAHRPHPIHSQSLKTQHIDDALSSNSVVVIVVVIISICIVFAGFLLIILIRKLKAARNSDNCNDSNKNSNRFVAHTVIDFNSSPDMNGGCISTGGSLGLSTPTAYKGVQVMTYKELELATDNFNDEYIIGNGGFGVVYKGVLADGTIAAIKKLHRDRKQGERAFRMEVDLLSRLHSPYLVQLLGYCADQNHRLLMFEFIRNGTLQEHLHHPKSHPLDWGTRLRIALDCARALEFLHDHAIPTVIHRDFKCSNVLLDQNFRAKVSDFGLAKIGSAKMDGQILTRVLGTTGYLAPEYASTGKLTTKSDVYSYGVVLLQLLTGRVPVDTKRPPGEHVLVAWALPRLTNRDKVVEMVDPALEGQYSKKDLIQVAAIAAMCIQPEADYRPLMVDVVQSLIPLVKSLKNISCTGSTRFQNQTSSPSFSTRYGNKSFGHKAERDFSMGM